MGPRRSPLNEAGLSYLEDCKVCVLNPTHSHIFVGRNPRPWSYLQMPTMILRVLLLLSGLSVVLGQVQYMGMNIAGFDFGCATNGSCNFTTMLPPLTSLGGSDGAGQMQHFKDDDIFNTFRLRWCPGILYSECWLIVLQLFPGNISPTMLWVALSTTRTLRNTTSWWKYVWPLEHIVSLTSTTMGDGMISSLDRVLELPRTTNLPLSGHRSLRSTMESRK